MINRDLPEMLQDPQNVLTLGRVIEKNGFNSWIQMDHYERAVRIAEEWWKTEEQRKLLVDIIKLAEQFGKFDHETRWP